MGLFKYLKKKYRILTQEDYDFLEQILRNDTTTYLRFPTGEADTVSIINLFEEIKTELEQLNTKLVKKKKKKKKRRK